MTSDAHPADTFPYPGGSVVGIVPDGGALANPRRRLEDAGFDADRYDVLHGEDGRACIDVDGSAHGKAGSLRRRLQSALSDDADHLRRYPTAWPHCGNGVSTFQ